MMRAMKKAGLSILFVVVLLAVAVIARRAADEKCASVS
jgi:hypothetical protein